MSSMSSKSYDFSISHIWMWDLDHKESWVPKNWCFQTVVLEKTLEINPVNPKGNQSWIFIGRTDAEAEPPMLRPPDAENWLIGRLWCWERLKAVEEGDDRGYDVWMAPPTHEPEFEQVLSIDYGQASLVCCSPCGHKGSDTIELLFRLHTGNFVLYYCHY